MYNVLSMPMKFVGLATKQMLGDMYGNLGNSSIM